MIFRELKLGLFIILYIFNFIDILAHSVLTAITIYVLLGWLDEGNNELEETFLLFQVFVEIFFTFEAFLKFFWAWDEVKGQNELQKCRKYQKWSRHTQGKEKFLLKFIVYQIQPA